MSEATVRQKPDSNGASNVEHLHGGGVGALLRASRQRVEEDVDDIAHALRISSRYIEAIEDANFNALPGRTYAIGFVRAYADHLGLDADEVVRRFKLECEDTQKGPDLHFPEPIPESKVPGAAIVLIGVVLAVAAYGGWYVTTGQNESTVDGVEQAPVAESSAETATAAAPVDDANETAAAETAPEAAADDTAASETEPAAATDTAAESVTEAVDETPAAVETGVAETAEVETEPLVTTDDTAAGTTAETVEAEASDTADEPFAEEPAGEDIAAVSSEPVEETAVAETTEATGDVTNEPAPVEAAEEVEAASDEPADVVDTAVSSGDGDVASDNGAPAEAEAGDDASDDGTAVAALTPPAPKPAEAAEAQPAPAATADGILLTATASSWVQIRDESTGETVVTKVLRVGDTVTVPDRPNLTLLTGNAGGIDIHVDGVAAPSIGQPGEIVRNVSLDGERLLAGTATN